MTVAHLFTGERLVILHGREGSRFGAGIDGYVILQLLIGREQIVLRVVGDSVIGIASLCLDECLLIGDGDFPRGIVGELFLGAQPVLACRSCLEASV